MNKFMECVENPCSRRKRHTDVMFRQTNSNVADADVTTFSETSSCYNVILKTLTGRHNKQQALLYTAQNSCLNHQRLIL